MRVGRTLRRLAAMGAVVVALAACGSGGPPAEAAAVAGTSITADKVEDLTSRYLRSETAEKVKQAAGPMGRKEAARVTLGYLIRGALLERLAAELGAQSQPADLDALAGEVPGSEFASLGWGQADLERALELARLSQAVAGKVFPEVEVPEADLRRRYEENPGLYAPSWRARARAAYFTSDGAARALRERTSRGESFAEAAAALGATQVGDLGTVTPTASLPEAVIRPIGEVPPGQVSDPVPGGGGWLAVLVEQREDIPQRSFEDARPELLRVLQDQERQQLFNTWFDKRLKEARVKVSGYYGGWNTSTQTVG